MTEEEYLIATNRVKISLAKDILADTYKGTEYGVDEDEMRSILSILYRTEERLFAMIDKL